MKLEKKIPEKNLWPLSSRGKALVAMTTKIRTFFAAPLMSKGQTGSPQVLLKTDHLRVVSGHLDEEEIRILLHMKPVIREKKSILLKMSF